MNQSIATIQAEGGLHALTHPQKRIWYVEQLYPGTPLHNLAGAATYRGSVDFARLELAFNRLVQAHDATRLHLVVQPGGEVRQRVAEYAPFSIALKDFSGERDPRAALRAWIDQEAAKPFHVQRGGLFRVQFFRVSPDEAGYFVNCHHLVADGWSFQVLTAFVSSAYLTPSLPAPAPSYLDFVRQERTHASSARFEESRRFWLDELRDAPRYPSDHSGTIGRQHRHLVPAAAAARLRSYAGELSVSVSSLLTALLYAYLWELEGSSDLVLGTPVANRMGGLRRAFGMFASTMPLRVRLRSGERVSSFVQRVHANVLRCFRHQRYPYDLLLRELPAGPGGEQQQQLIRVCVNYYNTDPALAAHIEGMSVSVEECFVGHQLFPLYLIVKEWSHDGALELDVNYKPSQYSTDRAEQLPLALLRAFEVAFENREATLDDVRRVVAKSLGSSVRPPLSDNSMVVAGVTGASAAHVASPVALTLPGTRAPVQGSGSTERLSWQFDESLALRVKQSLGADFTSALSAALCLVLGRSNEADEVAVLVATKNLAWAELGVRLEADKALGALVLEVDASLGSPALVPPRGTYGVAVVRTEEEALELVGKTPLVLAHSAVASGTVLFDDHRYSRLDAERLLPSLQHVLEQAIKAPDTPLKQLDVLPPAERHLLDSFNRTRAEFPPETTIIEYFEAMARRAPHAVAVRAPQGTWSYSEFNARANRLARTLRASGVQPGSIVPVLIERSAELLVAIYAILKAGGAYLPIDPTYPAARVHFVLKDSRSELVVTSRELAAAIEERRAVLVDSELSYHPDDTDLEATLTPRDLAYVCYTSGSTGKPKGVMIEHRSLVNRLNWMQRAYPLTSRDVLIQKTSVSFDVSVWELFWWGLAGASLCLPPPGVEKSPEDLCRWIEDHGVTTVHFVPSMFRAFLRDVEEHGRGSRLASLRQVFCSGEALPPELVADHQRLLAGAGTKLTNLYGPTEATVDVSYFDCPSEGSCPRVPIGRPIDNTTLSVLDSALRLQPIGAVGELYIGGIQLARGYLHREELTAERFVPDPHAPGERLYRTGDLARWLPDGNVEYLGRNDQQVKLRGFRIELGEVEAVLRQHSAVIDTAVTVRVVGEGQQLCAYVVLREAAEIESLERFVAERLPEHMVPSSISRLDALPLGPNGKLDRAALPSPVRQQPFEPPRSQDERVLAEIWQEVLQVPLVGLDDNFFALGGDSIKIISLLSRAQARGITLATEEVYRHRTIRELAGVAKTTRAPGARKEREPFALLSLADRPLLPPDAEDAYPLTQLQAGLIFQSQISRESAFYHDVFSYRIRGAFEQETFAQAVRELCSRHCIFRTTFHLTDFSEAVQIVHRQVPAPLSVVDLRGRAVADQEATVARDLAAIRSESYDWQKRTLIGFHVHVLGDSEYLYTIDFHDSALDGWSVNLIHRELFETYYGLLNGDVAMGAAPAAKFRDFVELEREAIQSEDSRRFWADKLAGSPFVLLPRWPHPGLPPAPGVSFHDVGISAELSARIKRTAGELGVPVKTVLLAAHVQVVSVLTGEPDVLTGYEYGGRPQDSDGERVLGLFLNTLPMRIEASGSSWRELVLRVHAAEAEFIPHRRYPMAQIKRDRLARHALFEHVFNFTHFHVLKELQRLPGFDLLEVMVRAETEFVLRAECSIHPFSDEVMVWLHYHSDAFPAEQVATIGGYYAAALEALTRDPSAYPGARSLLSPEERALQLQQFNGRVRTLPDEPCFHDLFEKQACERPEAVAANCGDNSWTYRELNDAANRFAHALLRVAAKGDVVAVAMNRDLPWMAAVIGCFKAGCTYLPLEVEHPPERLAGILVRSDCKTIIVGSVSFEAKLLHALALRAQDTPVDILRAEEIASDQASPSNPDVPVAREDLAYVIFTSGSTGAPKGAMIEHGGMLNHLLSKVDELSLTTSDVIVQNASQCFDISVWQLLAASLVGARVTIVRQAEVLAPADFIDAILRERTTILELVPSYLSVLLTLLESSPRSLGGLRYLLVTGEPVKAEPLSRWFRVYPRIPVVNAYGPTEAADDICHHFMTEAPATALVPVGIPVQNLNVYVLGPDLELLPLGTYGEICVSGIGVGRGYINDPERTRAVFLTDPFQPSLRLYRTGDVGRWLPGGVLELTGRRDEQVKVRGYRIEIGEVESWLHQCKGVEAVAVVVDAASSELVAFVVSRAPLDAIDLKRELAQWLPEYMIPATIVPTAVLPLSANGKVDKRELIKRLSILERDHDRFSDPQSQTERELRDLWASVLKVEPGRIGRRTDFFALGGHSLKAMELALRAGGAFTINDVFKYPTIQELAAQIERSTPEAREQELLVEWGEPLPTPELTLIGVSYAAGDAANFKPLFDALAAQTRRIACFSVGLPRGAKSLSLEDAAARCVEEIRRKVRSPIVLWGHCSGSALALGIARRLEAEGFPLHQVFIGGKVLPHPVVHRLRLVAIRALSPFFPVDAATMSPRQIMDWLVRKTGFDGLAGLDEAEQLVVAEAFRHDAVGAARYFEGTYSNASVSLAAPIVNVVAEDDLLTRGFRGRYKNWHHFSPHVELGVLGEGGHYFIKTRPQETAELILESLRQRGASTADGRAD